MTMFYISMTTYSLCMQFSSVTQCEVSDVATLDSDGLFTHGIYQ